MPRGQQAPERTHTMVLVIELWEKAGAAIGRSRLSDPALPRPSRTATMSATEGASAVIEAPRSAAGEPSTQPEPEQMQHVWRTTVQLSMP